MYNIKEIKNTVICGDTLTTLRDMPDECVDTIITSPPYWGLRDYGDETKTIWGGNPKCEHKFGKDIHITRHKAGETNPGKEGYTKNAGAWSESGGSFCSLCGAWYGQLGLEPTLDLFLEHLLEITLELKRVLKKTGVMFWNHGDCYNSSPPGNKSGQMDKQLKSGDGLYGRLIERYGGDNSKFKKELHNYPTKCLCLQNYRLILKMIDNQQWILRNSIIWHKPNAMPSSVKDRFSNSYEPVFMLVKNKKYWFDLDAVRKPHAQSGIERLQRGVSDHHKYSGLSGMGGGGGLNDPRPNTRETKIPKELAESFGSPRARYHRDKTQSENYKAGGMRNAPEPGETNAFNMKGKNPGDVVSVPTLNYYVEFDGRFYKVSEDCPIHSPYLGREIPQKVFYGGQQGLQKNRISDISKNPAQEPVDESVSTLFHDDENHQTKPANGCEQTSQNISENKISGSLQDKDESQNHRHIEGKIQKPFCNLDCSSLSDKEIAILHNKENRKNISLKVPDDNASDKILSHKLGRKQSSLNEHSDLPYLNFNTKKCTCQEIQVEHLATKPDVWKISTQSFSQAHFATFPQKLIEPMIMAGCPEKICKKCGKARVRIVELGKVVTMGGSDRGKLSVEESYVEGKENHGHQFKQHEHQTIGFTDCHCRQGWDKGIVLDPFSGSGTTALVAKKLGRRYVGIEINKEYVKMSEDRLRQLPEALF